MVIKMTKRDKTTVDDIIGIVHTDETTNSVEEVKKLRGRENRTEKRFTLKYINEQHISANIYDDGTFIGSIGIGDELIVELLNNLSEENEQLKADKQSLIDFIKKEFPKSHKHILEGFND